ncbi:MAG: hypothetical protein WB818_22120 [Desulfobacterales bacterium]
MKSLCMLLALLSPIGVMAAEPDFYLVFQECKLIIGSLNNGSLNVGPGDPPTFGCSRQGKNIACIVLYSSGGKPEGSPADSFEVLLDSPPYLYFASSNNSKFFSANTQTRAAVMTVRITDKTYTGEKLCTGLYATSSELNLLQKK